jgi:hypothetical protein
MARKGASKGASKRAQQPTHSTVDLLLLPLQRGFQTFKCTAGEARAQCWQVFAKHVQQHGDHATNRMFKARCLMHEVTEATSDAVRASKVAAFREYMRATYLDPAANRTRATSASGLCLYAQFLTGECTRCAGTADKYPSIISMRQDIDTALRHVSKQSIAGWKFVDPATEVMDPDALLPWEWWDKEIKAGKDTKLRIGVRVNCLKSLHAQFNTAYEEAMRLHKQRSRGGPNPERQARIAEVCRAGLPLVVGAVAPDWRC